MEKKNKMWKKVVSIVLIMSLFTLVLTSCGEKSESQPDETDSSTNSEKVELTNEERIISASEEGKVGNWGLGNEYAVQALLVKYGCGTEFLSQDFTMDGFDDDSITLASAMTYNELGLVKNDYDGGYGYGDSIGIIDMNDEGVAMLEDNIFCSADFAS